jgi:hypothetical protein
VTPSFSLFNYSAIFQFFSGKTFETEDIHQQQNKLLHTTPEEAMPKLTIWLLLLFIFLFMLGLNTGEIANILNSGISICLSCIGVG